MYDYSFVERVSIMLLFDEASESSSVRCRGGSSNHSFYFDFFDDLRFSIYQSC